MRDQDDRFREDQSFGKRTICRPLSCHPDLPALPNGWQARRYLINAHQEDASFVGMKKELIVILNPGNL
jgi:hypothetical protein